MCRFYSGVRNSGVLCIHVIWHMYVMHVIAFTAVSVMTVRLSVGRDVCWSSLLVAPVLQVYPCQHTRSGVRAKPQHPSGGACGFALLVGLSLLC